MSALAYGRFFCSKYNPDRNAKASKSLGLDSKYADTESKGVSVFWVCSSGAEGEQAAQRAAASPR